MFVVKWQENSTYFQFQEFKDTKGQTKIVKSEDRQHHGQQQERQT